MSVLASSSFNEVEINKSQKADAIKLAHLKTFTAMPLLLSYYAEVEKGFEEGFEAANELKKDLGNGLDMTLQNGKISRNDISKN